MVVGFDSQASALHIREGERERRFLLQHIGHSQPSHAFAIRPERDREGARERGLFLQHIGAYCFEPIAMLLCSHGREKESDGLCLDICLSGLSSLFCLVLMELQVEYRAEQEGNINDESELIAAEPILTAPVTLDGDSTSSHKAPGIVPKVISLFKSMRPGSDLTKFQLPPTFNMPKSQLQSYGECVYCIGEDLLGRCAEGKSPLERFNAAVAWCISTTRPVAFGMAPFNPILGETHHVSMGRLNVLLEQVSHHPPVSALHATDESRGIELIWCHTPVPRFTGAAVEGVIQGYRKIRLLNNGENYVMTCPKLMIRFLPLPQVEWIGNVTVRCPESGLEAILSYKGQSILGFGGNRVINGKVFDSLTKKTLYDFDGHWDKVVTKKEVASGKVSTLYNARKALAGLRTPVLKDKKGLLPRESSLLWAEVIKAILNNDWDRAGEAKKRIEERERKLQRERTSNGTSWSPRYFNLVRTKAHGWECSPKKSLVPAAPIVI